MAFWGPIYLNSTPHGLAREDVAEDAKGVVQGLELRLAERGLGTRISGFGVSKFRVRGLSYTGAAKIRSGFEVCYNETTYGL